jgi:HK97 family phage major capsid protein
MKKEDIQAIVKEVVGDVLAARKEADQGDNVVASKLDTLIETMSNHVTPKTPESEERGLMAGRFMRAVCAGKGDPERAARFAKKEWGDGAIVRALEASDAAAGGVLVPTEWSADVIELLRERAVVRSMMPTVVPMSSGSMQFPKLTGGATASYIGESSNIDTTEQTFGQINLTWKKLACLIPISNDLLRFEAASADAIIRDDAVASMAIREDQAFLRSDGSAFAPMGLLHHCPAANKFDANATVNLANLTTDLATAILTLRQGNCRFIRPGWIMAPRTEMYLSSVRDTNGNFAFRDEMMMGRLWGFPYKSTNEVPINLGTGTDESEVYLADFADVIIGEANTLMVSASDTAAYHDGTAVQASFSLDQTVMRLIAHHDMNVRHEESITVIEAVTWTP